MAILDSRTDTGKALLDARGKEIKVEICWFFSLTKEKYRIKCNINIWDSSSTDLDASVGTQLSTIWKSLNDDETLSFRRACPGEEKKKSGDELLQYEPQVENTIPLNFKLIELVPIQVDHLLFAPPPVVAD